MIGGDEPRRGWSRRAGGEASKASEWRVPGPAHGRYGERGPARVEEPPSTTVETTVLAASGGRLMANDVGSNKQDGGSNEEWTWSQCRVAADEG